MKSSLILSLFVFVCYAKNYQGQIFSATGEIANIAQKRAMEACYSESVSCQPLGCEEGR